ncbi:Ribosome maturation protein SBDS [Hondaea fermentalgiana]|uniref:Ribosome maturation protein SBDS n=1 Tax=Hondaea fermentalgiana TaxID=2315210 RepID=A0A2R5GAH9_9STRA|nr:Ribosome maturation protein SBDS [Hondaea fermentalgiana]|eukprot:GBG28010.1 Ribosome maturation protein SBDS [Hondaea fermentalgiana]
MSQKIQQAVNQVRLTNVAVVRLKRHGKRFEVACYRNKIENWRSGLETDIDEVLQIDRVFENVSKGIMAKTKDLEKAFGTSDTEAVCRIILSKGSSQVSEGERAMQIQNRFRNVATIVSEKCINPDNLRPYPVSTIETAMRDTLHFAAVTSKSAKQQALEVIRELEKVMPIKRAQMFVRVVVAAEHREALTEQLTSSQSGLARSDDSVPGNFEQHVYLDPGHFRALSEFVASLAPPGTLEVKDFNVQDDTEADVENADAKRNAQSKASDKAAATAAATSGSAQEEEAAQASDLKESATDATSGQDAGEEDPEPVDMYEEAASNLQTLKKQQKKSKKKKKKEMRRLANEADDNDDENNDDETASAKKPTESAAETRAGCAEPNPAPEAPPAAANPATASTTAAAADPGGLRCRTCNVGFGSDRSQQREHYKTDLHRLNLKLNMKKLPCMTQEEFDLLGPEERDAILLDYS